jgi:CHASE1-domain containing sensor protein
MELAYVTVIGAALGALARYALPGRRTYGLFLLPAIAAAVTAAVWVLLVWLGWTFDGGWIWVVSLVAGGVSAIVAALMIVRYRANADQRLLSHLSVSGRA